MNETGVSSHKGRYSGHLKLSRLAVVVFGVRRVRFVCDYLNGASHSVMQSSCLPSRETYD